MKTVLPFRPKMNVLPIKNSNPLNQWYCHLRFCLTNTVELQHARFLVPKISNFLLFGRFRAKIFPNQGHNRTISCWAVSSFIDDHQLSQWDPSVLPTQQPPPRWQPLPTSRPKSSSPDAAPPSAEWDGTTPSNCSRANALRPFCAM